MGIRKFFPSSQAIEEAPVASVAGALLKTILPDSTNAKVGFHLKNMIEEVRSSYYERWEAGRATSEALNWLATRGFICQSPHQDIGWYVLTRDGIEAAKMADFSAWTAKLDLPDSLLHPVIAAECLASFKAGEFDIAVFEAFKALEVRIRESSKLGHELMGPRLASKAFNPEDGPLTDKNAEAGKQFALMNLMSGALGYFMNHQSHRKVNLEAFEAREMVIMASHLYRIAEVRMDTSP